MPIEAMADPLFWAAPGSMNSLNSSGRKTPPSVSVSPTRSAPMNAPRDRTDTADDDDDEGQDQNRLSHTDLNRLDGPDQRPSQPGECRTQSEDQRVKFGYVDAKCGNHLAVVFAGADLHADPGAFDQQPKPCRYGQTDQDQCQAIQRVLNTARQGDRSGQRIRHIKKQREGAKDPSVCPQKRSGSARKWPEPDPDAVHRTCVG